MIVAFEGEFGKWVWPYDDVPVTGQTIVFIPNQQEPEKVNLPFDVIEIDQDLI